MKITQFDDTYTQKVGAGDTTLVSGSSGGSNSAFGGDVTGSAGSLSVVGLRQTVSLSSNLAPSAAIGNVLTLISVAGTPVAQFAVPSNTGGSALTVEEVDGSPTDSAVTKIVFPNGTLGIASHVATYTPAGGGSSITIEELDGSPTVSATKLVLPNGTLGVVGTVATYTPAAAGGASATVPNVVQAHTNGNAATSVTITAASSGNRLILGTNSTTGQITSPTCTNVTWTQLLTFTSTGSSFYAIWVGVVAGGSSGTSITMTKPGAFNTVAVLEVTDTLTPTLATSATGNVPAISGTGADVRTFARMGGSTAGRFIAMAYCLDNTGNVPQIFPGIPATGVFQSPGNTLLVGYSGGVGVSFGGYGINSAGASLIAEIT